MSDTAAPQDYCVYAHRLGTTGRIFYIGKGRGLRAKSVGGRTAAWHRIVAEHQFNVEVLASELSHDEALQLERLCIERVGIDGLVNQSRPTVAISEAIRKGYAHVLAGEAPNKRGTRMSVSVQRRGKRFQLRVKHRLLPRPFFHTFDEEDPARDYGNQLQALLDRGIVPVELAAPPEAPAVSPLVIEVIRAYMREAPHLTPSDEKLLGSLLQEIVGLRVANISYEWAERYVTDLKRAANLAPGTIRKRIGALARVVDWHLLRTKAQASNPLRRLPRGYSQYTEADRQALPKGAAVRVDVQRDRRLHDGEEARIRPHLGELQLLFDVIVATGMRLREAYRLRVDQVDLERGVIRVEGSKGARGQLKPRTVPMVPTLRQALRKHCRGRAGLLFPWWNGDPAQLDAVTSHLSYRFAKAFAAAGSADLTEHDLRHEATCRWFEHRTGSGWTFSEVEVCRMMGWSSTRMALRYASLRGEDLAARLR